MLKLIKLISVLLLLVSVSFAQSPLLTLMADDGVAYDGDAQIYFNSLTTALSTDQQSRINTFVLMLKDSLGITSLSSKFDFMYLLANETSEAGLKNLVKRSSDATLAGTPAPTFTQWEGFAGDGSHGYINTNYTPSTDAVSLTTDKASVGLYARTDEAGAYVDMGSGNAANTNAISLYLSYSGTMYYRLNSSSYGTTAYVMTAGFYIVNTNPDDIVGLTDGWVYKNGALLTSGTLAPDGLSARSITICAYNGGGTIGSFTPRQYAVAFIGVGLTATEIRKINNCVEWYMDELGKGVQ